MKSFMVYARVIWTAYTHGPLDFIPSITGPSKNFICHLLVILVQSVSIQFKSLGSACRKHLSQI